MRVINVHEAKTHLSRLLEEVETGAEIVVARAGRPVARLVPLNPESQPRAPGTLKGKVWFSADFERPLPARGFGGVKPVSR